MIYHNSINVEKLVISMVVLQNVNNYVNTFTFNTNQIEPDASYIYYNDISGINIFHNNLNLSNSSLIKLELTKNWILVQYLHIMVASKETILSFIDSQVQI